MTEKNRTETNKADKNRTDSAKRPGMEGKPEGGRMKRPGMGAIPKGTVKRLFSYLKGYKLQLVFVFVCIVLSALAGVFGSLFLQRLIDDYISPLLLEANPVFDGLARAILTMAGIYVVGILATLFYNLIMVTVAQSVLKKIRDEMFIHMQTLPIRYFDTHTHGDIMSHYTNDTDTLRQMIAQSMPQMISSLITVVSVFFAMLSCNLYMTLFVVVFVALMSQVARKVTGMSGTYFIRQQKSLADVNGYIEEMIEGQKVVKVFCHEAAAIKGFDEKNDQLCENATKANTFANILMPIMANLANLQFVLVAIIGGIMAVNGVGAMTLGTVAAFLQLSRNFAMPINQISQQVNMVIMALAGAGRIFTLMDEEPEEDHGYVTLVRAKWDGNELVEDAGKHGIWAWKHPHHDGTVTYTPLQGEVKFFDVDFGYDEEKIVLHNITLYAEPGQKVAFVGATGAGKTTITNLINRFYDLADGKIRYDGININKIKKQDLRRSLGIVLQDTNLFTGTIMENIRYGRLDATDSEVKVAARLANAHDFISRLPDGYDTKITANGGRLSQGQRQLIAIARAAVADPPVMILDEATSSIDTRTEAIVQRGMDQLMLGRTVFVIAHRLSTVQNSDVIMVLDHGRIIERGTHDMLIAEKGQYYQLYTGAFELS